MSFIKVSAQKCCGLVSEICGSGIFWIGLSLHEILLFSRFSMLWTSLYVRKQASFFFCKALFEVNARCYIMSIDMDVISSILEFLQVDTSAGYSSSSKGELGEDTSSPRQSNKYLWELEQSCSLKILQIEKVRKAYDKKHALGLFHLFLSKLWFKTLHRWWCKGMESKGRKKNTFDQFMAYVGLETAMSLVPLNSIKD